MAIVLYKVSQFAPCMYVWIEYNILKQNFLIPSTLHDCVYNNHAIISKLSLVVMEVTQALYELVSRVLLFPSQLTCVDY